jgi:PEP-CTERM motif
MKQYLLAAALAGAACCPAHATTVTFCGPDNGTGCEQQNEQKIFLNEGHDESTITGNVGGNNSGPGVVITADTGSFDTTLDSGGGFATIDASHGFKAFNGVTITIPGFTFTDLVFSVQMERQGGKKGDTETDTFEIRPGDLGVLVADKLESDSPDAEFEFNVLATTGVLDKVDLFADGAPLSAGFFEIKHLQVSGLAPLAVGTPEPSTWVMLGIGFASFGAFYRRRSTGRLATL